MDNKTILIIIFIVYCVLNYDDIAVWVWNVTHLHSNRAILKFIESQNHLHINKNSIPSCLKDKVYIESMGLDYEKNELMRRSLVSAKKSKLFKYKNVNIIDYLDYQSKYSFGPHTDIEWGAITNDGHQAWYLKMNENKNNVGNMFFIYNEYISSKYKDPYYIKLQGDEIVIYSNYKNDFWRKKELERVSKEWFVKHTLFYYLDIAPGDVVLFDKSLCHMTDTRGSLRHSINFRVVYGDIQYNSCSDCGYIHNRTKYHF